MSAKKTPLWQIGLILVGVSFMTSLVCVAPQAKALMLGVNIVTLGCFVGGICMIVVGALRARRDKQK